MPHDSIDTHSSTAWWQSAVFYQIYPWSFQDSNGDGIGDLPGIINRLDYLNDGTDRSLGIDAIWLSPVYPSPMQDFGYDVANYCDIDPRFGTLADFDRLVTEAHRRRIRIVMDLILNHTSEEHPWFQASCASKDSPERDWYYWADPRRSVLGRRTPPNNWRSTFGWSAWAWHEPTRQYYLHSFLKAQPDLNWANPAVRAAMFDVVRFWLDRGVDGFRLDAVSWLGKDTRWPDNPGKWRVGPRLHLVQVHQYDRDRPEAHAILRDLRTVVDEYPNRMLVGETAHDCRAPAAYYGSGTDELHLVFNFQLLHAHWNAATIRRVVNAWDVAVPHGGWPTLVLSNHDYGRHYSRLARGAQGAAVARRARAAALLLLTLRGAPFLYYGEELGMGDAPLRYAELRDPLKRYWPFFPGRDRARTPMQWDGSPHAGFTKARPWLPVHPNAEAINVAVEQDDPASLLTLYRRLLRLRRHSAALTIGRYEDVTGGLQDCVVYTRTAPAERYCVAINCVSRPRQFALPIKGKGTVLLSTTVGKTPAPFDCSDVRLEPDEGLLVRLDELG